jgi:uncharacterized lipoprotein YddW (UPF0748 family)
MRSSIILRTLFLLPFSLAAADPELRGVWIARDTLTSREKIAGAMKQLADANFNAAFVNVWSRGYPLWPSEVFEREAFVKIDPGFIGRDVLQEAIEEGKANGIAVIPWVEYGFVAGWSGYFPGPSRQGPVFEKHPDWLAKKRSGEVRFPIAGGGDFFWMAHANPEVQEFLIQLMEELARNYDIQAIEFDRARYPELDCGYDDITKELYARDNNGVMPPDNPNDGRWLRWRADNINAFLRRMSQRVKAIDWRILMTNAPIVYPYGYVTFAQDYPAWMREGSSDFITPQIYRPDVDQYERELDAQVRSLTDVKRLVPGLDITNSRSGENLAEQILRTRKRGTRGIVVWYHEALNTHKAWDTLKATVFAEKAPLPWR